VTPAVVLAKILTVPEQIAETSQSIRGRSKRWIIWSSLILVPVFLVAAYVCIAVFNVFHAHEHCIKQAGVGFANYSTEH